MIYLGTSGWYYKHWIGNFYPKNLEKSKWLEFYSKKFNTVEVNASFYRLPFKNMINGWKDKTPNNFLLTFKGSRFITHKKKLKDTLKYLEKFHQRVKLVKQKLGVIVWQLPPQVKKDINLLENFINKLDSDIKQCIEFRHKSWFDKKIYNILSKNNIAFCIISAPQLPPTIQVTADFAYFRWHGKNEWYNYNYSKKELNRWATEIKLMDVDQIYGYFNNDAKGFAPLNCLELKKLLMV